MLIALMAGLLVIVLAGIGSAANVSRTNSGDTASDDTAVTTTTTERVADEGGSDPATQTRQGLWVFIVTFVALMVSAIVLGAKRKVAPPWEIDPTELDGYYGEGLFADDDLDVESEPDAGAALAAVEDALARLRAETDPRRAVQFAYAAVETGLGSDDVKRNAAESPVEYLERTLAKIGGAEVAMRRLTDLFEIARFSSHEVNADMRGQAVEALDEIRAELERTTAMASVDESPSTAV